MTVNGCVALSGDLQLNLEQSPDQEFIPVISINSTCKPIGSFSDIEVNVKDCGSFQGNTEKQSNLIGVTAQAKCGENSTTWWIVTVTIFCVLLLSTVIIMIITTKNKRTRRVVFPFLFSSLKTQDD